MTTARGTNGYADFFPNLTLRQAFTPNLILRGALSPAEQQWLDQVQAISPEGLMPKLRHNMPDWLVAHLVSIARAGGKGAFSKENTKPIFDIVGRAPITTRQFAQDFKGAFG